MSKTLYQRQRLGRRIPGHRGAGRIAVHQRYRDVVRPPLLSYLLLRPRLGLRGGCLMPFRRLVRRRDHLRPFTAPAFALADGVAEQHREDGARGSIGQPASVKPAPDDALTSRA